MVLMSDELSVRELLIRVEGKIDVIQSEAGRTVEDIRDLRERANGHSERIRTIELDHSADKNLRDGEQRGFEKAVKAIYALAATVGIGSIAVIVKALLPVVGG